MHDYRQVMIALRLALDECEMQAWKPGWTAPGMNMRAAIKANTAIWRMMRCN